MSKYLDSKKGLEGRLGFNPLLGDDFEVFVKRVVKGGSYTTDGDDLLPLEYDLERDSKVSVYTRSDLRLVVSGLSGLGKGLFLWLMYEVGYGCDYIEINKVRYMRENGLKSDWSYRKGLGELVRMMIICPTVVRGVYWINPRYFFAGSRVKKYSGRVSAR